MKWFKGLLIALLVAATAHIAVTDTVVKRDPSSGDAPVGATYITQTANATLSAEQALNSLTANRLLRNTTGGVLVNSILSDDGTNVTLVSGKLIMPPGTAAAPTISPSDSSTSGLYFDTGNATFSLNGTRSIGFTAGTLEIFSNVGLLRMGTTADVELGREAAAVFQMGSDSSAPIAQTLKGPDGSGINIAGGNFTLAPGRGTGTGAGGSYIIATAPAGVTGSSQNALITRLTVDSTGLITLADAVNFTFNATTGTKFGTATTQKLAFYNATPVVQQVAITANPAAAPAGGTGTTAGAWDTAANRDAAIVTINDLRTRVSDLETRLKSYGLLP